VKKKKKTRNEKNEETKREKRRRQNGRAGEEEEARRNPRATIHNDNSNNYNLTHNLIPPTLLGWGGNTLPLCPVRPLN
jgi:hypothetical protein